MPPLCSQVLFERVEARTEGNHVVESFHATVIPAAMNLQDKFVCCAIEFRVDLKHGGRCRVGPQHTNAIGTPDPAR